MQLKSLVMALAIFAGIFFHSLPSYSQGVDKYKITGMSVVYKDKDGEYLYHRAWVKCDYLVVIDAANKRIKLYQFGKESDYDIISIKAAEVDKDKNLILRIECVDGSGGNCGVRLITLNNPPPEYNGDTELMKFEYSDITIIYRYKEIK